jgi:hypothetical protein
VRSQNIEAHSFDNFQQFARTALYVTLSKIQPRTGLGIAYHIFNFNSRSLSSALRRGLGGVEIRRDL